MRVLVTGGGGFVGRHVARALMARGIDVVAGFHRDAAGSVRSIAIDVANAGSVNSVFNEVRPSHVVHCAAHGIDQSLQDFGHSFSVNVTGTLNVARAAAAAGVARFVHVGSCSEYASSDQAIPESAPQCPNNLYATTKAAGTLVAMQAAAASGLHLVVVRPFGMWGPGEPPFRIVPQIIAACRTRTRLDLTPCDILRDYSFVGDIAEMIAALTVDVDVASGTIVNLGSGRAVLLRDFALSFAGALDGVDLLNFGARPHRSNEQRSLVADTTRLVSLLGMRPATSLADGLRQTLSAPNAAGAATVVS